MTKAQILSNVAEILKGIAEECKAMSRYAMTQHGINDKVGSDTLTNSNIYNSIEVKVDTNNALITILVDGYIDYIQGGRKPNKPFPWKLAWGTIEHPGVLVEWASKKGLPTDNTTIYFIWKSIIEKGISPRPVFEIIEGTSPSNPNDVVMEDLVDKYWDDWADQIFEAITEGIDYEFQNKE